MNRYQPRIPTASALGVCQHLTQKPIKLIERLIQTSSNEGDLVLDPFGGSGSTLISAEHLNRVSLIIEKESKYIEAIKDRFAEEIKIAY